MTEAISTTSTTPTSSAQTSGTSGTTAAISSDFETFLHMLTAQLEHQDPLNPVESTDYAVQLATFSSVEQQVLTNDLLTSMLQQDGYAGLADFAHWIGMDVQSPSGARFDGASIPLSFDEIGEDGTASLVVRDSAGAVVQRVSLQSGTGQMTWDGLDEIGQPFDAGIYHFSVETSQNGIVQDTRAVRTFDKVVEVHSTSTGVELVLGTGATVTPDAVTAVRNASSGDLL